MMLWWDRISAIAVVQTGANITLYQFQQKKEYYNIYSWWNKRERVFDHRQRNIIVFLYNYPKEDTVTENRKYLILG